MRDNNCNTWIIYGYRKYRYTQAANARTHVSWNLLFWMRSFNTNDNNMLYYNDRRTIWSTTRTKQQADMPQQAVRPVNYMQNTKNQLWARRPKTSKRITQGLALAMDAMAYFVINRLFIKYYWYENCIILQFVFNFVILHGPIGFQVHNIMGGGSKK